MNPWHAFRRLQAFHAGKPLPRGTTLHLPLAESVDILALAFVRMGGESSPWGIAYGRPDKKPKIVSVPDGRDRTAVGDMMTEFGPVLLGHLMHPSFCDKDLTDPDSERPLRQVWFPNPTHLEMLHLLAYAYTFTKFGDPDRAELLRKVGRACGWLFRESQRPGQVAAMVCTEALRESFVFPAEDTRQAHLGYLLAWLTTKGGREARLAHATVQEQRSIATSLDPAIERDSLADLVEAYNNGKRTGDKTSLAAKADEIALILHPELERRVGLVTQTIDILRADKRPTNEGVEGLVKASRDEHWKQYLRTELDDQEGDEGPPFVPSPETDRYPAAAAARYYIQSASQEFLETALIHDDKEVQAEALATGDAIRGKIVKIRDEGGKNKTVPVWTVKTDSELPLRLREGAELCVVGLAKRRGRIRRVLSADDDTIQFEIEITGLKTANGKDIPPGVKPAAHRSYRNTQVMLVKPSDGGISRAKSRKVWKKDGPGAWLTHAKRLRSIDHPSDEIAEDVQAIAKRLGVPQ